MQRGITLLEMLIALVVLAAVSVGVTRLVSVAVDDTEISVIAAHTRSVGEATNAYIKDNYGVIAGVATATQPVLVRVADLVSTGYLSPGFSTYNAKGQAVCSLVLEPTAGKLAALVVADGGNAIDDLSLGQLAATIGGSGAGIYSDAPSVVRGAIGGFSFAVGAFANPNHLGQRCDGTGGSVLLGAGRPAMALWFADGAGNESTLYRNAVPGNPELNTMNTPILLGVGSVQVAEAACTPDGALARDASGAVLSCVSSVWKKAGSSFWQDPVPNFASLPACDAMALNHTRVVRTPTTGVGPRGYTCDGAGTWRALAIDDSGNITVPGRANVNQLEGNLQVTSVGVAGAACSSVGRIAMSAAGDLLTCKGGVWTASGGGFASCQTVAATYAVGCPAGKRITGGGCYFGATDHFSNTYPSGNAWYCGEWRGMAGTAYAICC